MDFEDLKDPEFQERLKSAQTVDDLVELAKNEGVELTDDEVAVLAGGSDWYELGGDGCRRWGSPM